MSVMRRAIPYFNKRRSDNGENRVRQMRMEEVHMKVTAIMPARGRPDLAGRAVVSFLSQDYPNKELLILDDEDCQAFPAGYQLGGSGLIRYVAYTGERQKIAEKRNWLCENATGEIIMHFDSDDWSAPHRMRTQVERLVESGLSVTGYHSILFYDAERNAALKYRGHISTYAVGTSLAFRRSWWAQNRFIETVTIGEDNEFVKVARKAKQIIAVDGQKSIVARIHKENTCPKDLNGCSFQPLLLSDLPKDFF